MKNNFLKKNKAQILVISIFLFIIIFLFTFLIIEVGNFIYTKIHLQNTSDAAALEGGLWYARLLNLAAFTNKVLFAGYAITIISAGIGETATELIKKAQDFILVAGPYFVMSTIFLNGYNNKILNIPLFNKEVKKDLTNQINYPEISKILNNESLNKILKNFSSIDSDYSIIPNFNIRRQGAKDILNVNVKYYYKHKGIKHYVPESNVYYNKKAKRYQLKYPVITEYGKRRYFVTREVIQKLDTNADILKTFIEEKGEHFIWVLSIKSDNKFVTVKNLFKDEKRKQIKPSPFLITMSKVEIVGGSLDVHDLNGARYSPVITRAGLPVNINFLNLNNFSKEEFFLH